MQVAVEPQPFELRVSMCSMRFRSGAVVWACAFAAVQGCDGWAGGFEARGVLAVL